MIPADIIAKALRRAYTLGQRYQVQIDHEFTSENEKANETQRWLEELIDETIASVAQGDTSDNNRE